MEWNGNFQRIEIMGSGQLDGFHVYSVPAQAIRQWSKKKQDNREVFSIHMLKNIYNVPLYHNKWAGLKTYFLL